MLSFDVTGSNYERAVIAQQKLPFLMDLLQKYLTDPQVSVAANDDVKVQDLGAIQVSDFESDNRVDEHIRNVWLTQNGGCNQGESYDLILYIAARKVALDSVEKRGKKGYLFLYADEPIFDKVEKSEVLEIFGDTIQKSIPIEEIIEEARRNFNIFVLWPQGGYDHARAQYVKLFGDEYVITLQHPNLLCELVASTIGMYEDKATATSVITDLVSVGVSEADAKKVGTALAKVERTEELVPTGKKAKRL